MFHSHINFIKFRKYLNPGALQMNVESEKSGLLRRLKR